MPYIRIERQIAIDALLIVSALGLAAALCMGLW
jgi:hypothetical protein